VIDIDDLATRGAHALTIASGDVRISTVAEARGQRPWSTPAGEAGAVAWAPDWQDDEAPPKRRRSR
jgi:hypothetical protein